MRATSMRVTTAAIGIGLLLSACSGGEEPGATSTPTPDQTTSGTPTPTGDDTEDTGTPDTSGATGKGGDTASGTDDAASATTDPAEATASDVVPQLDVEVVASGLTIPWDVQLLPDGTPLVTEREGRLLRLADGAADTVDIDLSQVLPSGEGGLMGLAVSPDFEQDRTIFLCHTSQAGGAPDVRVTRWVMDEQATSATEDGVVVEGQPFTSGRHSGCRLLFTPDGNLLVGTGDAADETNPQDLESLGGKVLSVTPEGEPTAADGNVDGADPRILTYGHRNVQGLALRPGTDEVWEVEHGSSVDDEVNILEPGANYGWDPGPGYDESVPMTDLQKFPDAVEAVWSSGDPTHATSGAVFLQGPQWGAWDGALAVAELKGSGVTIMTVDGDAITDTVRAPELDGTHGRLRSLTLDADGALWVTTSNGTDDQVLKVTPRTQ